MSDVLDAEKQIEQFVASHHDRPIEPLSSDEMQEKQVEDKAREKQPLSTTIRQKRSTVPEKHIDARIAAIIRKYPQLEEAALREQLALKVETSASGELTEEDLHTTVESLLAKKQQEQQEEEKKKIIPPQVQPPQPLNGLVSGVGAVTSNASDWLSTRSTPGGIALLIAVLVFFLWVLIPVNGQATRMELLFGLLTGRVGFSDHYQQIEQNPFAAMVGPVSGGEKQSNTVAPTSYSITYIPFEVQ